MAAENEPRFAENEITLGERSEVVDKEIKDWFNIDTPPDTSGITVLDYQKRDGEDVVIGTQTPTEIFSRHNPWEPTFFENNEELLVANEG